jgi:MinD superfamily P-loop ATPase
MAHTLGSRFGMAGTEEVKDYYNNHLSEIYRNSCIMRDQIDNHCSICDSDSEDYDRVACNGCTGCPNYTPPEAAASEASASPEPPAADMPGPSAGGAPKLDDGK